MIFEQELVGFYVLDVIELSYGECTTSNSGRNYSALSFRYSSDATIETKKSRHVMSDGTICHVPSNVNYVRQAKHDRLIVIHFESLTYSSDDIECFFPQDPEKYRLLFEEALKKWNSGEISYKYDASSVLCRIFSEIYKESAPIGSYDPIIRGAVSYLEENYRNPDVSVKEAARRSSISEVYLRRLFGKAFGVSPKKYIVNKRIKYAAGLIISGYYTLREVSELSGFNDYKYFSTEFKKATGRSPSKYSYNYK